MYGAGFIVAHFLDLGCCFDFSGRPRASRASMRSFLTIQARVLSSSSARDSMMDFISGVTLTVIRISFFMKNIVKKLVDNNKENIVYIEYILGR